VENKGAGVSNSSPQRGSSNPSSKQNFLTDSTFPGHPLLSANLAKTPIPSNDNNMISHKSNELPSYPSTSPPFLPPGNYPKISLWSTSKVVAVEIPLSLSLYLMMMMR